MEQAVAAAEQARRDAESALAAALAAAQARAEGEAAAAFAATAAKEALDAEAAAALARLREEEAEAERIHDEEQAAAAAAVVRVRLRAEEAAAEAAARLREEAAAAAAAVTRQAEEEEASIAAAAARLHAQEEAMEAAVATVSRTAGEVIAEAAAEFNLRLHQEAAAELGSRSADSLAPPPHMQHASPQRRKLAAELIAAAAAAAAGKLRARSEEAEIQEEELAEGLSAAEPAVHIGEPQSEAGMLLHTALPPIRTPSSGGFNPSSVALNIPMPDYGYRPVIADAAMLSPPASPMATSNAVASGSKSPSGGCWVQLPLDAAISALAAASDSADADTLVPATVLVDARAVARAVSEGGQLSPDAGWMQQAYTTAALAPFLTPALMPRGTRSPDSAVGRGASTGGSAGKARLTSHALEFDDIEDL